MFALQANAPIPVVIVYKISPLYLNFARCVTQMVWTFECIFIRFNNKYKTISNCFGICDLFWLIHKHLGGNMVLGVLVVHNSPG